MERSIFLENVILVTYVENKLSGDKFIPRRSDAITELLLVGNEPRQKS